jgi:protein-disulfide isomerase
MLKRCVWLFLVCGALTAFLAPRGFAQEDPVVRVAIETVRTQMRVPQDVEMKFVEKKESQIPGFYAIKLLALAPDREIPIMVYVDQTGEKVLLGNLFVKGENVTRKEAGSPKPRKIDMAILELEKSPARGAANAKVTIVEFSNFQCPYCVRAWSVHKGLIEKYPSDIKYVFKHYPLQNPGNSFEFSEMVAAVQEVSQEAFWLVHDFFFSAEGQTFAKGAKEAAKQKIEELLKARGFNVETFRAALGAGKGKKRVEEDLAVGRKIRVRGTPTTLVNGDFIRSPLTEKTLEEYLKK